MKIVLIGERGEVLREKTVRVKRKKTSDFHRYLKGLDKLEKKKRSDVKPIVFK